MSEPMFIEDCWYVAAEPEELAEGICARKIMNRPVILFRTEAGEPVALEDRCAHRYAPLSNGRLEGDIIRCGYHGICFDKNGRCVAIPGQDDLPESEMMSVRTFPVLEKYGYVWIWMGDPKSADGGRSIPSGFYIGDDPGWRGRKLQMLSLNGYYELINDNLFDVSHAEWVHGSTLGADIMRLSRTMEKGLPTEGFNGSYYQIDGDVIRFGLHANGGSSPPAFSKGLALKYGKEEWPDATDWHLDVQWWFPSFFVFDVKTRPAGSTDDEGVRQVSLNALTPETETSTHYFFTVSHNYHLDDESVTTYWADGVAHAFHEDKEVIGAQQARILEYGSHDLHEFPKMTLSTDLLGIHARRLIRQRSGSRR